MNMNRDFETFGLDSTASMEEVRSVYKKLVKTWHPDQFPTDSHLKDTAEEKIKQINSAYGRIKSFLKYSNERVSQNRPETGKQSRYYPFQKKMSGGNVFRCIFGMLSEGLDRIFDPEKIQKKAEQSGREGDSLVRRFARSSHLRKNDSETDSDSFENILNRKLHTKASHGLKVEPIQPKSGKRNGRPGLRRSGYVRRTSNAGPISPIQPVSRVRGIGKDR